MAQGPSAAGCVLEEEIAERELYWPAEQHDRRWPRHRIERMGEQLLVAHGRDDDRRNDGKMQVGVGGRGKPPRVFVAFHGERAAL